MALHFKTKVKLGAALGTVGMIALPLAAQASTSSANTAPVAPVSGKVATATKSASISTATAPVTEALAPKAAPGTTQTLSTPAPAGSAEAYAADVAGIVAVSHTRASASGSGTSSTADPLEIGGKPLAPQLGGAQSGPGSSSNALLDTGPSSQFRLALTPWTAKDSESSGQNSASAVADIVILDLGDQTTAESASLRVLQSTSDASWNSSSSSGSSSSDGAILTLGGPSGLKIDLLHSDASSNGTGSSYLLSANGTEIGTNGQVNGQCALSIPPLLSLDCLTASGGAAGAITSESSGVLSVILGTPPAGAAVGLIQSTSSGSSAATPPSTSSGNGAQQGSSGGQQGSSGGQSSNASGSGAAKAGGSAALAFTGANLLLNTLGALVLLLLGALVVWTTRRLRAGPVG